MEVFEDMQACIETDQIDQFEWSHRMIETQFERLVYISRRGNSLLQHIEGFVADDGIDAAGNEPGRFFDHDDFLTHASTDRRDSCNGFVVGFYCPFHFDELHLVYRIEKVHSNTFTRAKCNPRNFGDAQR